ncbi:hypothetical protein OG599_33840 [Streptomyces sp. NBC_01335]|uniref:hypothetical protein n=1 Tax=Streptomyces sp. NBC_01335 TaxID=2903828 RepID=UPI002E13C5E9|nr:hypothetical protein OG599_33840 [Streptomyces sp. NBC_01335]
MMRPTEIGYSDELLADGSVHRSYQDGRQEWRRRDPAVAGLVRWHDDEGASGTDELLGDRIVKRVSNGQVTYGRDLGYGRTVWGRGDTLTVNRTSFGGRMGLLLAGIGVTSLAVTEAQLPPLSLSPEEEEELRRQAQASGGDGGAGGDGAGSGDSGGPVDSGDDDWDGDWGDGDDGGWSDDDFG